jgi:molybdenum cofactor biosynthesis protein B
LKPPDIHRQQAKKRLRFHLLTVSSSRYQKRDEHPPDESGDVAEKIIRAGGHTIQTRRLISDDARMLKGALQEFMKSNSDVLAYVGGTGLSKRDITIETVRPYFEKEISGFGELLRSQSFVKVGAAAMLSRATAGVAKGRLILCLPGSPDAVETALSVFISEFPHAVHIAKS